MKSSVNKTSKFIQLKSFSLSLIIIKMSSDPMNEKQFNDYRTIYSPTKSLHSTLEVCLQEKFVILTIFSSCFNLKKEPLTKNSSKSRKTTGHSSSPTQSLQQRSTKKSLSSVTNLSRQRSSPIKVTKSQSNEEDLVRSSSCDHVPSSDKHHPTSKPSAKHFLSEQLTKIQTIAKQIQTRNSNDSPHLWNRFDKVLSTTISFVNDDLQFQTSLQPLRNEIHQLTK